MRVAPALDLALRRERVRAGEDLRDGLRDDIRACEGRDDEVGPYEGEGVGVRSGEDALVEASVTANRGAVGSGVVGGSWAAGGIEGWGKDGECGAVAGAEDDGVDIVDGGTVAEREGVGGGDGGDARDAMDGFIGEEGDDMVVYDGDVVGGRGRGEEAPGGIDGGVCGAHGPLHGAGV